MTFSTDAAEEIRTRVANQFGDEIAARIEINTFHGFGWSILQDYGDRVGVALDARIIDEVSQEEIINTLLGSVVYSPILTLRAPGETVVRGRKHIDYLKDRVDAEDRFLEKLEGVVDPELKRKAIGNLFIEILEEEARKQEDSKWLAQGTI